MKYDYLVVGSGLFGCVVAENIASVLNKKVLILEKRNHIGGNCYSEFDSKTNIEYHNMELIYSIQILIKFGIILINLPLLIITNIKFFQNIKTVFIKCLLI